MNDTRPITLFFGGLKHCGKTTHALKFANAKKYDFIDIDREIEKLYQLQNGKEYSCRQIYKKEGKKQFHQLEYEALLNYLETSSNSKRVQIVSLGGGICDNQRALTVLKESGYFIYLYQEEAVLFKRMKAKGLPPYLGILNPKKKFHKIFEARNFIYSQIAVLTITSPNLSKEETQEIIASKLEEFIKQIQKNKRNKK